MWIDHAERINRELLLLGSHKRLLPLIYKTAGHPDEVFWRVWLNWWNVCDLLWLYRGLVVDTLQERHARTKAYAFQSPGDRAFYDALPSSVEVFRGGNRSTIRGVSWTLDRKVAEGFATGKR